MPNRDISTCADYLEAVFRRRREPMEPRNFSPNWIDQPSRYKIYREVERIPLPLPTASAARLASMAEVLERISRPAAAARALTFADLATMLYFAHGVLNRRLDVNWNQDQRDRAMLYKATYGRGTASGGGMYPTEMFWAAGASGPLLPGLYHYDNGHHVLARLLSGDFTGRIRAALARQQAALRTDQFLLISLNFWKNSFKYNSFCYHVVTEDLGALLASLRLLAVGFRTDLPFLFWYHDEELNRLLGLETLSESVFVVVPLPLLPASADEEIEQNAGEDLAASPGRLEQLLVRKPAYQRSREMIRFPTIERVHRSALIEEEPRPSTREAFKASCDEFATTGSPIELPPPAAELLQRDLLEVFLRRRSSFGRFSGQVPLSLAQFAILCNFASTCRNYRSDLKADDGTPSLTRLMAFVNRVDGLERGIYAYDGQRHCLWPVSYQYDRLFLQENYYLQNYNLSEIAALLVIVGRPQRMLEIYGNRGYRILNAEVGMMAQSIYMAATALSCNCGAALGFDNVELNSALGLDGTDERSFLFILVGHGPQGNADFDARLI